MNFPFPLLTLKMSCLYARPHRKFCVMELRWLYSMTLKRALFPLQWLSSRKLLFCFLFIIYTYLVRYWWKSTPGPSCTYMEQAATCPSSRKCCKDWLICKPLPCFQIGRIFTHKKNSLRNHPLSKPENTHVKQSKMLYKPE
jgi:hypothetical protein